MMTSARRFEADKYGKISLMSSQHGIQGVKIKMTDSTPLKYYYWYDNPFKLNPIRNQTIRKLKLE
jgi:hypothetical protein